MAGVHLIFIEEPEAHLHPQMQEVFIKKIQDVADSFGRHLTDFLGWPVQFIISTHSAHIANAAQFESIRYFLAAPKNEYELRKTRIIDLRNLFNAETFSDVGQEQSDKSKSADSANESRDFIHQYMTLTRCDLFFADKAILIEGPAERILLPRMIEKIDIGLPDEQKLSCQYITVMEVGGDYAYHFFKFLDFLELPSLIITDIDAVTKNPIKNPKSRGAQTTAAARYRACPVSEGQTTCNNSIKKWYKVSQIDLASLRSKKDEEKTLAYRRLAYQVAEQGDSPCGRSFEDAFILANLDIFRSDASTEAEQVDAETFAWNYVNDDLKNGKTDFAIKYAIAKTEWLVPRYIADGLRWLATAPGQCDLNQIGDIDKSSLGDSDA